MVGKLLVGGCSYTDIKQPPEYGIEVWPTIVSKKLDRPVINTALAGAGNELIYSSLLREIAKKYKIDLIIVMWTEFGRYDFHRKTAGRNGVYLNMLFNYYADLQKIKDRCIAMHPDYVPEFIFKLNRDGYSRPEATVERALVYFYSLQEIAKSRDIPLLQIFGTHPGWRIDREIAAAIIKSDMSWSIDKENFIGWPIIKDIGGFNIDMYLQKLYSPEKPNQFNKYDHHPNKLGHQQIADLIYDNIIKRKVFRKRENI